MVLMTAAHLILVDSQLAKQSSLAAVSEILNGCMLVNVRVEFLSPV